MKKYSLLATELLSHSELCEIKAGKKELAQPIPNLCGVLCTSCMTCTSSCTSMMLDVII